MPPSNSPLPGERPFRDIPYTEAEETHPAVDVVDGLLQKMKLSTGPEVSVDELAHTLKEHFNLEGDDSNIRNLAHFVMSLNLKDAATATTAATKENSGYFYQRGSNPRMPSLRSLSRSRGASSPGPPDAPPAPEQPKPIPSRSPLRSQSPGQTRTSFRRNYAKPLDANGIPPVAPVIRVPSRPTPVKAATATTTPTVPTTTNHYFSFAVSPPSSTGTFDSLDRTTATMDSIHGMPDTPGFCVETPPHGFATTTTPLPMPEATTAATSAAVGPQDAAVKTGHAKRRNKNDTISPHVFPSQQQQQQPVMPQASFHQSIRSPPQFNVNLKKTRKPAILGGGTTRLRRQQQQPRPSSQPEPLSSEPVVPPHFGLQPQPSFVVPPPQPAVVVPPQQTCTQQSAMPTFAPIVPPAPAPIPQTNAPRATPFGQTDFLKTTDIHDSLPTSTPPFHVNQATTPTTPFVSPMDLDVKFNIGSSSSTSSAIKRHSPGSSSRTRRNIQKKNLASPKSSRGAHLGGPENIGRTSTTSSISSNRPLESKQSSFSFAQQVQLQQQSTSQKEEKLSAKQPKNQAPPQPMDHVDYSGRNAMMEALRREARDHYSNGQYRDSVNKYTAALTTYTRMTMTTTPFTSHSDSHDDDRRAILLANRAAALLMLGAYEASIYDCKDAIKFITITDPVATTGTGQYTLTNEGGPILKSKVYTRMGRACIKRGELDDATKAFDQALEVVQNAVDTFRDLLSEENRTQLSQIQFDATSGKCEITRCRESVDVVKECGLRTPKDATTVSRRVNLRGLSHINSALSLAPACHELLEMKLAVLAALKRWRELYLFCERIAADTVNFDGVFTDDLLPRKPLPNVPNAKYLRAGVTENDEIGKLSSKAVAEATLRLPASFQSVYIRALRLEERCHPALNAVNVLCDFVNAFVPGVDILKLRWIIDEKSKLDRTIAAKERGDFLFRTADYKGAVDQYTACLKIDSEDRPTASEGEAGGRLNAVLHCNRAAAYMALLKYREAIADCTVSLRIHSHYMKAMLRRSRCYVRLNRFDEAQAEYERYIKLVESARDPTTAASSNFDSSPCVFDGPKDVKDSDLSSVQEELNEVKRAKINAENNKRREEVERQNRQNWYQETFGQSQPGDAERRREEWYSQQGRGSRRWDSFNGRGPNPQGNSSRQSESFHGAGSSARKSKSYRDEQPRQEQPRQGSRRQDERKENVFGSPGSDASICHYKALGISPTATDVEIKKAYKMAALKYHPDKNQETGATDMFRRVKLAYDVLKDPTQKREYDTQLRWSRRY